MALIQFALGKETNDTILCRTFSLPDMWKFIRDGVNVPQDWTVYQGDTEEYDACCNANFLLHTYKRAEDVPHTLDEVQ